MVDDAVDSAFSNFGRLLMVEMQSVNEQMHQSIGRVIAQNAARGLAISGNSMSQVATEAANTIPVRSKIAIDLLARTLAAYGVTINNAKPRILTWSEQFLDNTHLQLRSIVEQTAPFRGRGVTEAAKVKALGYIFTKTSMEKQRFIGEINLMAAKSLPPLDDLANTILIKLKKEFVDAGRPSEEILNGYEGPGTNEFEEQIRSETGASKVDYDLSLKALEDRKLVDTGPKVPYENPAESNVFIIAIISKREHIYLTEAGYRAASNIKPPTNSSPHKHMSVSIHSSTFNQSLIGVGETVTQSLNFDVTDENKTVQYLSELLGKTGTPVDDNATKSITEMVRAANDGNMRDAKPIFQKLFGAAQEAIKQLAYGVITTIITKQMGM